MGKVDSEWISYQLIDVVLDYQRRFHLMTNGMQHKRIIDLVKQCAKEVCDVFNENFENPQPKQED